MEHRAFVDLAFTDLPAAIAAATADPSLLRRRDPVGETAMHYLVVENRVEAVEAFIRAGSDVNTADEFGDTPLMHAVRGRYGDMVELLLRHGADVDRRTVNDDTALSYAVMADDEPMARRLLALCRQPLESYFSDLDASRIHREPATASKQLLIDLGLADPYPDLP